MGVTMAAQRGWRGPAILSFGFRPFFLGGAVWAATMIAVWVPWYLGLFAIPSALGPFAWHAHELLFGYLAAVMAGFLLTAVPNWTGRMPVAGWPLAGLFGLWLLGRAAVAGSAWIGAGPALGAALLFPLALCGLIWREILASGNRRNMPVAGLVTVFAAGQAGFAAVWLGGGDPLPAERTGVAAVVMLVILIGGRITPSFTATWMRRRGAEGLPAPFSGLDRAALGLAAPALVAWAALPWLPEAWAQAVGALLLAAGLGLLVRQLRWAPGRTGAEPLVTVLHVAYAFAPVGFGLAGAAAITGDAGLADAGLHAWTVGMVGLMTLAVMTRATRGHTGRALEADRGTSALYLLLIAAALARIAAALLPAAAPELLAVAALGWAGAFAGFAALYGPMLCTPRRRG